MLRYSSHFIVSLLVLVSVNAIAQSDYPARPIRLIVPFPPAGGTDLVSRLIADKMRDETKWTFVIDNRPGAGGNIGMEALAKSPADGYTLGMGQSANLAINPSLYSKMPYDPLRDVVPIAIVAAQPMVLVVKTDAPFKTLADLVAAGKTRTSPLTLASAGNGTVGHLTGEMFTRVAGFKMIHVPYRGAGPALTDLLGGQVNFYLATPQSVLGFIKAGTMRALAVSSAVRMPALPDVPTIAESGYKGFEATDWKMLVAPAHTPAAVVARLNAEVQKALARPDTQAQLLAEGSAAVTSTPQEAQAFLQSEYKRWAVVIRDGNIRLE